MTRKYFICAVVVLCYASGVDSEGEKSPFGSRFGRRYCFGTFLFIVIRLSSLLVELFLIK